MQQPRPPRRLFNIFPVPVLGVILFVTGAQLALGTCGTKEFRKNENFAMFATAAFAMWNIGIAFVFSTVVYHCSREA